jgi:predicted transcriptional regulator of viral defense system
MTREMPDEALDLLDYQAGVLSRRQALRAGMTGQQIDTAARTGRWQRLQVGVYAAFSGEPGRPALLWAALLRAGPAAVLSHYSAAELHGLVAPSVPDIHVMAPTGRQIAPIAGVVLHYSSLVARERHPALRPPGPASKRPCSISPSRPTASIPR